MLDIVLIIGGSLIILLSGVYIFGNLLPRDHTVSLSRKFPTLVETIYNDIINVKEHPKWRSEVNEITNFVQHSPTEFSYTEVSKGEKTSFSLKIISQFKEIRTEIINDGKNLFGGSWTFKFEKVDNDCLLIITEQGYINPPFFRAINYFFYGQNTINENLLKQPECQSKQT